MDENRTEYGFAALTLTFTAGALIGGIFGLLFAPRPGVETRGKMLEGMKEVSAELRDAAESLRNEAKKLTEAGKEKYSSIKGKIGGNSAGTEDQVIMS